MKTFSPRHLLTASALAVTVGLGYAVAQTAQPDISPEASQQAQEAANNNEPLSAPDTASSQVMPDSFADLVQQVAPAVVNITTTAVVAQPTGGEDGPMFPEGSPFSDLFRDFGIPGVPGSA